ncbi:DUF1499 domain-containing protein [Planktotalea sp.]|uniref:DUF1499 domain-containing protein n=1 Tax=Planktotalea sp. TaxID=2029877 RepID=UPI003297D0B9
MFFWIVLVCLIVLLAYIRLAPSDAARWHVSLVGKTEKTFAGGVIRSIDVGITALDKVVQQSGARVLAGSAAEGHVTYIARTKLIGFPDYVTVQTVDGKTMIYGRLRFGRSDLGVNGKRIDAWLAQL